MMKKTKKNDKKQERLEEAVYKFKFTKEQNFILALIGVITLAVSVNIVELACSAGLPMLFSSILAINNIHGFTAFVYTLLYILFFLLDDIIVFVIVYLMDYEIYHTARTASI